MAVAGPSCPVCRGTMVPFGPIYHSASACAMVWRCASCWTDLPYRLEITR